MVQTEGARQAFQRLDREPVDRHLDYVVALRSKGTPEGVDHRAFASAGFADQQQVAAECRRIDRSLAVASNADRHTRLGFNDLQTG